MSYPHEIEHPGHAELDGENHIELHNKTSEILHNIQTVIGTITDREVLESSYSVLERLYLIEKEIKELLKIKQRIIDTQQNTLHNIKEYIDSLLKQK